MRDTKAPSNTGFEPTTASPSFGEIAPAPRIAPIRVTGRELAVARLVARGLGNKEIAVALGISEHTVCTHLRRSYAKLGARSRAEMVSLLSDQIGSLRQ